MSLDNQRNLKLAIHRDPVFLKAAEQVAGEMNTWAGGSSAARSSATGGRSSTSPPNIPIGSEAGVTSAMKRAVAGGEREQREGASGKWVAHWKMVHIVRPVWEKVGHENQLGRQFPPLTYRSADADGLILLEARIRDTIEVIGEED